MSFSKELSRIQMASKRDKSYSLSRPDQIMRIKFVYLALFYLVTKMGFSQGNREGLFTPSEAFAFFCIFQCRNHH